MFVITEEHIGRNGFTRKDLGRWAVMDTICRVFYIRDTEEEARELVELFRGLR